MCEQFLKSARFPARVPVQAKGMCGYLYLVKQRRKWGTYPAYGGRQSTSVQQVVTCLALLPWGTSG